MTTKNIIDKIITDIYLSIKMEVGGLDIGKCSIQIDGKAFFDFPIGPEDESLETNISGDAESIFKDLSDVRVYHVNKEGKNVGEIARNFKKQQDSLAGKLRKLLFGKELLMPKEYAPYKVEFQENRLKHIKDKKIVDFIWYPEDTEKGLLLLENGYLITETLCAPHGTGLAGLNIFDNIDLLVSQRGGDYLKLSDYEQEAADTR